VILALRKLNRQPYFFLSLYRHAPSGSAGKLHTEFVTLYRAPPRLLGMSCAHGMLLCQSRLGRHAPRAATWFVSQSLQALL
jgi:hypothetical protein